MARPITTLAIFFLSLSLFSGVLISSGVAATIGIDGNVQNNQAADQVQDNVTQATQTGSPGDQTLFGLYNVLATQLSKVLGIFNPGLVLLSNAGVPDFLVNGLLIPVVSLVKFIGIVSFLRGWDL